MKSPEIIIALDFPEKNQALTLVKQFNPKDVILKVGLEMFTRYGPSFIDHLVSEGFRIFLDLKFHDIPNTVAGACEAAAKLGVWMINLHALGGKSMMLAAREALNKYNNPPLLIAVTVLTSMSGEDLQELKMQSAVREMVLHLAGLSREAQADGIVCSALEVPSVREAYGNTLLTVTPGIRPASSNADDQKRIVTPEQAMKLGSDYLVIGRPITHASNPNDSLQAILKSIRSV